MGFMLLCVTAVCAAAALAATAPAAALGPRVCELYAGGGTPCVAAFSTTRALYAAYDGPLYQIKHVSDGASRNIGVLLSGYVDAAAQDRFCAHTTCEITALYDQSPDHNNLTIEGPGGNGNQNAGVVANKLRVMVGGHEAYGLYFGAGMGYRNNHTTGIATGGRPESMYMVISGTHFNSQCCFDFGNAETNNHDAGNGHMDAIYFGSNCGFDWPTCDGSGPCVKADLENGLFFSDTGGSKDPAHTGNASPFVTAVLKNNGIDRFAIKDANAQHGPLATRWSGPLPNSPYDPNPPSFTFRSPRKPTDTGIVNPPLSGYRPMRKEGAIVLGTGGDDSNTAIGSFFEGVMTAGYATDATENAVQANIVAVAYSTRPSAATSARPKVRLAPSRKQDRLRVILFCPSACTVSVRMTLSRATARRLAVRRRSVILLKRSIAGSRSLELRLPTDLIQRARSARLNRLSVTVTVTANSQDGPFTTRTTVVSVKP